MKAIVGYTVLTQTISGWELTWSSQEGPDSPIMPDVYEHEWECEAEIQEIIMDQIGQVEDGERAEDEVDSPDDYYIARITIDEVGNIVVGPWVDPIIETTLEKWRAQL